MHFFLVLFKVSPPPLIFFFKSKGCFNLNTFSLFNGILKLAAEGIGVLLVNWGWAAGREYPVTDRIITHLFLSAVSGHGNREEPVYRYAWRRWVVTYSQKRTLISPNTLLSFFQRRERRRIKKCFISINTLLFYSQLTQQTRVYEETVQSFRARGLSKGRLTTSFYSMGKIPLEFSPGLSQLVVDGGEPWLQTLKQSYWKIILQQQRGNDYG